MAMTYDEQQTFARLSLWNRQHGQEIRMAETLPDDEEDEDDIEDEDEYRRGGGIIAKPAYRR